MRAYNNLKTEKSTTEAGISHLQCYLSPTLLQGFGRHVVEYAYDPPNQTGQVWHFSIRVETVGKVCKWPGRTMGVPGRDESVSGSKKWLSVFTMAY